MMADWPAKPHCVPFRGGWRMGSMWLGCATVIASLAQQPPRCNAAETPELQALEKTYQADARPLIQHYCYECHSGDLTEAQLDFGTFATLAEIRKRPSVWQKIGEMLDGGRMPPEDALQPTQAERMSIRTWVRSYLTFEARERAGDPGRVVLRRLNNAEYTYTLRDLTGVPSLDPAREFPADSAAGEGFTNTGNALVMSPALVTKYLDAAKGVAGHAVLLPDGFRFSPYSTRRDWTEETLARIRNFYREYTDNSGGSAVNLQGIQFETNQGGRLPVERYLAATLDARHELTSGKTTLEAVARQRDLNAKYLAALWNSLTSEPADGKESPLLLGPLRARWRTAKPADARALADEIALWQRATWKFNAIGHIGKHLGRVDGPQAWMEPECPLAIQQDFKLKLPASGADPNVVVCLVAGDAGDGNDGDVVVWKNPRLEIAGQPAVPLRAAAGLQQRIVQQRHDTLAKTERYLAAAAGAATDDFDAAKLAARHDVDVDVLRRWLDYLDIGVSGPVKVEGLFTEKLPKGSYEFINGWGSPATPSIAANSSDKEARIPGIARPHSVVAHPSPTQFAAVGWSSPIQGEVRVEARLADAHPECGNGVEWVVQHRSGRKVANLWQGDFGIGGSATMPAKSIQVREGDVISFILGPRNGDHTCDLTDLNLVISEIAGAKRVWDLAKELSSDILAGNPHSDSHGFKQTWHMYQGKWADVLKPGLAESVPPGSLLAQWQAATDPAQRRELAAKVQSLAVGQTGPEGDAPNAALYRQLQTLASPTNLAELLAKVQPDERFGKNPLGGAADPAELVVQAPAVVEFHVPRKLAEGRELVVTGALDAQHGREGSVQLQVLTAKPETTPIVPTAPIVVNEGSQARRRIEASLAEFRQLFPAALCYTKIVPVDEVVTLTLFYREDDQLRRLMLGAEQAAQLDRLWDELNFISQEPLLLVNAFEQIAEFATQDRPDMVKAFGPMRKPIGDRAEAFRKRLVDCEPAQLDSLLEFADRAYRRPLTDAEAAEIRGLYASLRKQELPHEEAFRLTLARVLVAPAFLYRLEQPGPGAKQGPVSNHELAARLSYFLWSSQPDKELRDVAAAGKLHDAEVLVAQMRRMLRDDKSRRLAVEFAGQWLHIRDFDQFDEKSERHFPTFSALRAAMYEESVQFFTDLFQNDRSVLDILDADYTFLNEDLAKHYGIPGVTGPEWRRVDGIKRFSRGGILTQATMLAKQSGASRTSPILRGNWLSEVVLGEKLPRPPKNVPQLAETVPAGLTERQLIEKHTSVAACAKCHSRIDPLGFALENFDAIGRFREQDAAGHAINSQTQLQDGTKLAGLDGLRGYLLTTRREAFVRQFCRKLLGYSLGRSVQFSDESLLIEMQAKLTANEYRIGSAVEAIVRSRQFREIRGRETAQSN